MAADVECFVACSDFALVGVERSVGWFGSASVAVVRFADCPDFVVAAAEHLFGCSASVAALAESSAGCSGLAVAGHVAGFLALAAAAHAPPACPACLPSHPCHPVGHSQMERLREQKPKLLR